MVRVKPQKTLNLNYVEMFTKEWAEVLTPLLTSTYMFNLMSFIQEMFDIIPNTFEGRGFAFPHKRKLFDNFRSCPYNTLRVVIIGNEPYANTNATGIPFAVPPITSKSIVEPQLEAIVECVDDTIWAFEEPGEDGKVKKRVLDETMYQWTYQGVLMLHSAHTSEEGTRMAHAEYWRNFTREVVKTISSNKENIVFMLWGKEALYFEKHIDRDKHAVLIGEHPQDAIDKGKKWDSTHFIQCDKLLAKIEGDESKGIYW